MDTEDIDSNILEVTVKDIYRGSNGKGGTDSKNRMDWRTNTILITNESVKMMYKSFLLWIS